MFTLCALVLHYLEDTVAGVVDRRNFQFQRLCQIVVACQESRGHRHHEQLVLLGAFRLPDGSQNGIGELVLAQIHREIIRGVGVDHIRDPVLLHIGNGDLPAGNPR